MHDCGHDGHMAYLLCFAKVIAQMNELKKSILFIFQPAKEEPGGRSFEYLANANRYSVSGSRGE